MNIFIVIATLIVIVIGVFHGKTNIKKTINIPNEKVLSSEDSVTPMPTNTPLASPPTSPTPNQPLAETPIPTTTPTSNAWQYPNSTIVSQSQNSLSLKSSDSADAITNWYKLKLKEMKLSSTAIVQTSTNGNVLNKLGASNGSIKVQIEIKKSSNESTVTITINL